MRILTRYILKEISSHALLGLALFSFVLFTRDVGRLLDLLVRSTTTPGMVVWLFLLLLPAIFTLTIPMAVLVGTLIGLSRMSSDGEVIATRAAGLNIRAYVVPVAVLALAGVALSLFCSAWLAPRAVGQFVRIENSLRSRQASVEVQPRVFEERFPNLVLYVNDVASSSGEWRGVFLADLSQANGSQSRGALPAGGPKITVAERALAVPDPGDSQIQLHLVSGSTHQVAVPQGGSSEDYLVSSFQESDIPVALPPAPVATARPFTERPTASLLEVAPASPDGRLARIEFHRRLALPAACLILALVAIPLGVSSRKGGKSMGVLLTLLLVFAYYLLLIAGVSLARQGRWSPGPGVWLPDAFFLVVGVAMLLGADSARRGLGLTALLRSLQETLQRRWTPETGVSSRASSGGPWVANFPQVLDAYVVRGFFFYFLVFLAGFTLLVEVLTLFDLLNDIIRFQTPWLTVASYFFYLAPQLIYVTAPIAVLVAALVGFGVLSKANEITALKACGVSLYRASLPVLLCAAGLSVSLFAFDHFYLPEANRRQEALRNQIKGRPAQTYLRPDRKWILGQRSRIYYYNFFDPGSNVMGGVTVFELDPGTFQLRRRIYAARAHWEEAPLNAWVFEDGWVRDFRGIQLLGYRPFRVETFAGLEEKPSYFKKEVKQSQEMNYFELKRYVADLKQSGFDVVPLLVQLHKKFAFPLFALIMALIAVPFSFTVGRRGALAGVAVSLGIAMVYWTVSFLFEKLGNINELPATVAAWAPVFLFGMSGLYLLLNVET